MDSGVLGILGFVLIFIALDVAALRFGHDSRSLSREPPLGSDPAITLPRPSGRRLRRWYAQRPHGWTIVPPREPLTSERPWYKPFRPSAPRPAACHFFDLAAAGK